MAVLSSIRCIVKDVFLNRNVAVSFLISMIVFGEFTDLESARTLRLSFNSDGM
jgi:hypothetical protein